MKTFGNLKFMFLLLTCGLFFSACATVNVPNLGEEGYEVADDEQRLRNRSDELCEALNESDYIYDNQRLEDFLNEKAQKFLSQYPYEHDVEFYIRVLAEPEINAFAVANGSIYLHTGLIALTESEAQLVSVLAHEIVHVLERHSLRQKRSVYNKTAFMSTFGSFGLGGLLVQFGGLSSIYGYSQHLEKRADLGAFKMLKEAGYDVNEIPEFYQILADNLLKQGRNPNYFFSTHPKVRERVRIYKELIDEGNLKESGGKVTSDEYESLIDEVIYAHIPMCLDKGYFSLALSSIKRLEEKYPQSPKPYYYKGEVYRQWQNWNMDNRKKGEDFQKALEAYQEALDKDSAFADAYRGMGYVYQKQNEIDKAAEAYKNYLSLAPGSPEAAYIRSFLKAEGFL